MSKLTPKAYIKSTGCISNMLDGTGYEEALKQAGYELVKNIKHADIILINTCAFNQLKEDEAIKIIEDARAEKRNDARVLVCGCLPDINAERLGKIHNDIAFGPRDKAKLADFLKNNGSAIREVSTSISYSQYSTFKKAIFQSKRLIDALPALNKIPFIRRLWGTHFVYAKDVFCLKVEIGCWGSCSYCAIRFAKGRTVSKPYDEIMNEFEKALAAGYTRFVLAGDEITAYGRDLSGQQDIIDIINVLIKNDSVKSIFLESFEPSFLITNLDNSLEVLSSPQITVFCSSAQSGSNRILKLMRRNYEIDDYIAAMTEVRRQRPDLYLRSEIIVGFPGESGDEFQESLSLVKRMNFDFLDIYEYEDRPNTVASRMAEKISAAEKRRRRKILLRQHWKNLLLKRH